MRFKKYPNRYLSLSKDNINQYIKYILVARNSLIESGMPTYDVDNLLKRFLKIKKRLHV